MAKIIGYWQDAEATSTPFVMVASPASDHNYYRLEVVPEGGGCPYMGIPYDLIFLSWGKREKLEPLVDVLNDLFTTGKLTRKHLCMNHQDFCDMVRHLGFEPRNEGIRYVHQDFV